MFLGTTVTGKLMDTCYRKIRDNRNPQAQTEPKTIDSDTSAEAFPIEQVRLQFMPYIIVIYTVMNAITSSLVDLVPNQGSSITACVSL